MTASSLRRACGQLLSVGFDGLTVPAELLARISKSEVGGVMLFRPNIESAVQVASVVKSLRLAGPADASLVVAVDQEGGRVQRLRAGFTDWPDMASVGAAGDVSRTRAVGRALGGELAVLGIGWNFAPVLDVHTNPRNPVIGNRAFASLPEQATNHALAFWRGLHDARVLGCGKHYPGHGDTRTDSHRELPRVEHAEDRLRAVELSPFAAAARAGIEAMMTAHVVYPAWDDKLPATLSRRIAHDILRRELGFSGMLVSDDLGMAAVADHHPIETLVVESLLAGVDHFLVREPRERQVRAYQALVMAAERKANVRARVDEAARRVARFKQGLRVPMPAPAEALPSLIGTSESHSLAASFTRLAFLSVAESPVMDPDRP